MEAEGIVVRYVWLDEKGEQVSPIHRKVSTALNFVEGWHERWDRLNRHNVPEDSNYRKMMTRTGEPPVKLKRVVIETKLAELMPGEQTLLDAWMRDHV